MYHAFYIHLQNGIHISRCLQYEPFHDNTTVAKTSMCLVTANCAIPCEPAGYSRFIAINVFA